MLFARSGFTRSTLVLFALMLPASALNLRWMVLGVGGSRAIALGQILSRIVVLAGIVLLVADSTDLERVPLVEAAGAYVYAVVILVLVGGGIGGLRPRVDLVAWGHTLRQSAPLMVSGVARAAVVSFDIILIDLALGPRDVGIYGVASKPAQFVGGVVGLFSMAFLSAFSATAHDAASALQRKALRWSLGVGILVAACVCVSSVLIPFVFGEAYEEAVPVLAIIAWRIPLAVLASTYGSVLIARDRQTVVMRNNITVAVFVIVADLLAVLAFGLLGAAVVSVAAAGLTFLLHRRSALRVVAP
jgi:O-antigen/teichoic acid export membrane protein